MGCVDASTLTLDDGLKDSIGYIKPSDVHQGASFGDAVSLSADGNTLAIGAFKEDSDAPGINGDGDNNEASDAGAVYVFTHDGDTWQQQAYIKASDATGDEFFGRSISLDSEGSTLAVGAHLEDSGDIGVNGDAFTGGANKSGAAYVFVHDGSAWTQQAFIKASNTDSDDEFGGALSFSNNGDVLVVGAQAEDSSAVGINGNDFDNTKPGAGAAFVFHRAGQEWTQHAYFKATNTGESDRFGNAVSLSGDGESLAISARGEDGNATGTQASAEEQADDSTNNRGVVYLY